MEMRRARQIPPPIAPAPPFFPYESYAGSYGQSCSSEVACPGLSRYVEAELAYLFRTTRLPYASDVIVFSRNVKADLVRPR
jgi:hypothetical protein